MTNLPWLTIARKVRSGGIAGGVTLLAVWAVNLWVPGVGDMISPAIEQGVIYLATMAAAYTTAEDTSLWLGEG